MFPSVQGHNFKEDLPPSLSQQTASAQYSFIGFIGNMLTFSLNIFHTFLSAYYSQEYHNLLPFSDQLQGIWVYQNPVKFPHSGCERSPSASVPQGQHRGVLWQPGFCGQPSLALYKWYTLTRVHVKKHKDFKSTLFSSEIYFNLSRCLSTETKGEKNRPVSVMLQS